MSTTAIRRREPLSSIAASVKPMINFQTPHLYGLLGYTIAYEHKLYPQGIIKYIMVKRDQNAT